MSCHWRELARQKSKRNIYFLHSTPNEKKMLTVLPRGIFSIISNVFSSSISLHSKSNSSRFNSSKILFLFFFSIEFDWLLSKESIESPWKILFQFGLYQWIKHFVLRCSKSRLVESSSFNLCLFQPIKFLWKSRPESNLVEEKSFFQQFSFKENHRSIYENRTIFKFLLVRHPFQRIYSTFYDKFVNNQIDDTISGWKQLEEDILLQIHPNETLINIRRNDRKVDLRTFLLYIIDSIRKKQIINSHWEQITQRCGLCLIDYDWIGKIENFEEDQKILLKKFREVNLRFPSKEIDRQENKSARLNHQQLIELFRNTIENDQLFQILIDYYQPDFHLFDYPLPQSSFHWQSSSFSQIHVSTVLTRRKCGLNSSSYVSKLISAEYIHKAADEDIYWLNIRLNRSAMYGKLDDSLQNMSPSSLPLTSFSFSANLSWWIMRWFVHFRGR